MAEKCKVLHPVNKQRSAGSAKNVKSSIIDSPTANSGNLQPFNKKKK